MKKIAYKLFEIVNWLVAHAPNKINQVLSFLIYICLYYIFKYRRLVVATNLKNSFPEKSTVELKTIEIQYYKHISKLFPEILKSKYITKEYLKEQIQLEGYDLINQYLNNGKKVIILSGHFGNWEWASVILGIYTDYKLYSTYKPISDPYFENYYKHIRSKFGNITLPMNMMPRTLIAEKQPCITGILADQTPSNTNDVWMPFLNQDTLFFGGVEKLAIKIDAAVVFANMVPKENGKYLLKIIPITDSAAKLNNNELTEIYVKTLENCIRENPYNWLWSHKRWKHKKSLS
jgi:KDO2-lipid IV(A) lauroyltransferase